MIDAIIDFFYMNGYGHYVFSAYTCVILFLFAQWFVVWRRYKKRLRASE